MTEERAGGQTLDLGSYGPAVEARLEKLQATGFGSLLWSREPGLWSEDSGTQTMIRDSLGWLDVADTMAANFDLLAKLAAEVREAGFRRVVHMGMGGSSLAPLVLARTIPRAEGGLPLTVLDTTDPATVLAIERAEPLAATLFIVASKSGTTAEPVAFEQYFYEAVSRVKGDDAGENFIAITDPGTSLAKSAVDRGFRHVFLNFPDIGGRYSALSFFGLAPAALIGADLERLLDAALDMKEACGPDVAAGDNPGLVLGSVMGELALAGRDKVTFLAPEPIAPLAMWLEQLLAESTGKEGKGLLPVAGEEPGGPDAYGNDRLFVYLHGGDNWAHDWTLEEQVAGLKAAGHPVVTIEIDGPYGLGGEFLRWEIATAVAGAVIGINPFDQPNVQESKDNTNRLLAQVARTGELPPEAPLLVEEPLSLYHDAFVPPAATVADALNAFLGQARPGDYVSLMAYLTEDDGIDSLLASIRGSVRRRLRVATTSGYGPRFLHSTGQFHKGGPNTGLFLQLTCDDREDAQIPGAGYGFGVFRQAQALGDLESLRRHGRRVMRIHLGPDAVAGLSQIETIIKEATLEL